MTDRTNNILTLLILLAVIAFGFWLFAHGADPVDIKQRLDRVESIRDVFGKHVRAGVYWKQGETAYLWTAVEREDRGFYYTDTGIVATFTPDDTCDSQQECEDKLQEMCSNAGHGGVDPSTVIIVVHPDASSTCSGSCTENCNANGCPVAFVICEPVPTD